MSRVYDFFKTQLVRESAEPPKFAFFVESNRLISEYLVKVVVQGSDVPREVITTPSMLMARRALDICTEISVTNPTKEKSEKLWNELLEQIARAPKIKDTEAAARRQIQCQQKMLDSFVKEPMVTFGRSSFIRSEISGFNLVYEKASIFVCLLHKDGRTLVCWSGTIGQEKEAQAKIAEYRRLYNIQYIDQALAADVNVMTPISDAPPEALVSEPAGTPAADAVNAIPEGDDEDEEDDQDEDDDVDDKPAKQSNEATVEDDDDDIEACRAASRAAQQASESGSSTNSSSSTAASEAAAAAATSRLALSFVPPIEPEKEELTIQKAN